MAVGETTFQGDGLLWSFLRTACAVVTQKQLKRRSMRIELVF
jgi:hypothetical protein